MTSFLWRELAFSNAWSQTPGLKRTSAMKAILVAMLVTRKAVLEKGDQLASRYEYRRLLAIWAHLWMGFTQVSQFFENSDAARQAFDRAVAFLKGDHTSDIWDDLRALEQKLLVGRGTIDGTLRAWSQGSLGDKTFQQYPRRRRIGNPESVGA